MATAFEGARKSYQASETIQLVRKLTMYNGRLQQVVASIYGGHLQGWQGLELRFLCHRCRLQGILLLVATIHAHRTYGIMDSLTRDACIHKLILRYLRTLTY